MSSWRAIPPEPSGPESAAASRWRHARHYTMLRGAQHPISTRRPTSQESRRSGGGNYTKVICETRKIWCILGVMESKKALTVLAEIAGLDRITMTDAAKRLGVYTSTISRREKDGWELKDILALADAYGVSRVYFMLRLGYLNEEDLGQYVSREGIKGLPLSALSLEIHQRTTGG